MRYPALYGDLDQLTRVSTWHRRAQGGVVGGEDARTEGSGCGVDAESVGESHAVRVLQENIFEYE